MSATNTTNFANRLGMDWLIFAPQNPNSGNPRDWTESELTEANALIKINYVNVSNFSVSGDKVWATGGRKHRNKIAFNNPMTGTLTLTSQLMTKELLHLAAGDDIAASGVVSKDKVSFGTGNPNAKTVGYIMKGVTVWKDKNDNEHLELVTVYNATPTVSFGREYNGEGDPQSCEVAFELNEVDGGSFDGLIVDVSVLDLSDCEAFDATSGTYAVGDYVTKEGYIYKCKTAISTAAAWDADKWDQICEDIL